MIDHAVKNITDIKENVNVHYQCKQQNKLFVFDATDEVPAQIECIDIILISNCLYMLEDYELVYNECVKYKEVYRGKTSYVFIALKLNESEKRTFKYLQPWNYLIDIDVPTDLELFYEVLYLENRSQLGIVSIEKNSGCVLGKKIVKKAGNKNMRFIRFALKPKFINILENNRL
ncbi:hypothetical protein COBT_002811 [Conglomerata obtusa]